MAGIHRAIRARGSVESGRSDQRRLIQRKHRLIGSHGSVGGDFHQHALEAGGQGNGFRRAIRARGLAAGMLVGNRTAIVIVAIVIVMAVVRITIMPVA